LRDGDGRELASIAGIAAFQTPKLALMDMQAGDSMKE
jgi:hypothetical protein